MMMAAWEGLLLPWSRAFIYVHCLALCNSMLLIVHMHLYIALDFKLVDLYGSVLKLITAVACNSAGVG